MTLVWSNGRWFHDRAWNQWVYRKPGNYDPGVVEDYDGENYLSIPSEALQLLIPELEAAGWITPRLDERLRAEDLKITHRLLDMLERNQP